MDWVDSKVQHYRSLYGDDFCIIFFRDQKPIEWFAIPYRVIADGVPESHMRKISKDGKKKNYWTGTIESGVLKISKKPLPTVSIDVSEHRNASLLSRFKLNSVETDDVVLDSEGAVNLKLHRYIERSSRNKKLKIEKVLDDKGKIECEVCLQEPHGNYGFDNFLIDCHHLKPLSELTAPTTPELPDLALLCPNCHRAIHRMDDCSDIDSLRTRYWKYWKKRAIDSLDTDD